MVPLQILLVEDSTRLRKLETELLNAHADLAVVAGCASESEALALLARTTFDVIILDLGLKSGTGFGVLRWLAGSGTPRFEKVVVFSNYVDELFRRVATDLGALHFFDKAHQFSELTATLLDLARSPQPRLSLQ